MTAEIAVMNKDAVALAADSTVTVSGRKTYHTTNKLFALSKCHPVGIMIYGSAELAGIPWETLIKLYRKKLDGRCFDTLGDYQEDFVRFLENDISQYNELDEKEMFLEYAEDYLEALADEINASVEFVIDNHGEVSDKDISVMLESLISKHHKKWMAGEEIHHLSKSEQKELKEKYSDDVSEIIDSKMEQHKVGRKSRRLIVEITIRILICKVTPVSGLVIAGFGDADIFPKLIRYDIEGMVAGRLKHEITRIDIENDPAKCATIVPFAQRDTVTNFMEGISSFLLRAVYRSAHQLIEKAKDVIKEKLIANDVDADVEYSPEDINNLVTGFMDYIDAQKYKNHVLPVLDAIQYLPKNEMAEVAESLVSITSFRQKISLEQESVGGAIDVAVISKSDGFVWIKRKHYFEASLNPMFFSKYIPSPGTEV